MPKRQPPRKGKKSREYDDIHFEMKALSEHKKRMKAQRRQHLKNAHHEMERGMYLGSQRDTIRGHLKDFVDNPLLREYPGQRAVMGHLVSMHKDASKDMQASTKERDQQVRNAKGKKTTIRFTRKVQNKMREQLAKKYPRGRPRPRPSGLLLGARVVGGDLRAQAAPSYVN